MHLDWKMQKFHSGDLVHVAKDLGPAMSHFKADVDAVVIGSYNDQYGGRNGNDVFTLYIKGRGRSSWYYDYQLTLIERGRHDKIQEWEAEAEVEKTQKSDLNWIFDNGSAVLEAPNSFSIQVLADSAGLESLWGSRGEGITYYTRAMQVLHFAEPFLKNKDKEGWLEACNNIVKGST